MTEDPLPWIAVLLYGPAFLVLGGVPLLAGTGAASALIYFGRERTRRRATTSRPQKAALAAPARRSLIGMFLRRLRERFVTHLIGDYVPVLNLVRRPTPWPSLDELRAYPKGSLGRSVVAYLDARGLPFKVRYENHDAIHAILGYETNIQGEMELQAFLWANGSSSNAGRVLFVLGGLLLPEQWHAMGAAFARGREATPLAEERLPFRLGESLGEVRGRLEPAHATA